MIPKTMNVIYLVQIATVPKWSGRNLGAIALEHTIKERLQEAGYDLLIICGCTQGFYRRLKFDRNPGWLKESPFNLDVPETEDADANAVWPNKQSKTEKSSFINH